MSQDEIVTGDDRWALIERRLARLEAKASVWPEMTEFIWRCRNCRDEVMTTECWSSDPAHVHRNGDGTVCGEYEMAGYRTRTQRLWPS